VALIFVRYAIINVRKKMTLSKPLMTPAESKVVGFEGEMLKDWPGKVTRQLAIIQKDRLQLIRWYRYLDSPTDDAGRESLKEIIKSLEDTCPIPKKSPEPVTKEEEPTGALDEILRDL